MQEVPPYNLHGSLDDSLQNLRKVVPVPPRRDYVKYMDNIGKLLRYEAQLVNYTLSSSLACISECLTRPDLCELVHVYQQTPGRVIV